MNKYIQSLFTPLFKYIVPGPALGAMGPTAKIFSGPHLPTQQVLTYAWQL